MAISNTKLVAATDRLKHSERLQAINTVGTPPTGRSSASMSGWGPRPVERIRPGRLPLGNDRNPILDRPHSRCRPRGAFSFLALCPGPDIAGQDNPFILSRDGDSPCIKPALRLKAASILFSTSAIRTLRRHTDAVGDAAQPYQITEDSRGRISF
jgi:hypothetical protein